MPFFMGAMFRLRRHLSRTRLSNRDGLASYNFHYVIHLPNRAVIAG